MFWISLSSALTVFAMLSIASFNYVFKGEDGTNATEDLTKTTCFDELGCFDNGPPWRSFFRPALLPQSPKLIPTDLYFYSRNNINNPYKISTYKEIVMGWTPFNHRRPTLLVVHGYLGNSKLSWMMSLKDVYLQVIDANVFITDWGSGGLGSYRQAISNIRVVGRVLSRFMKYLVERKGLNPESVHLVGHSLGAHICAYIAKSIPGIGRLTALDPAQPGFEFLDPIVRLDKSDAEFVEVVHTDPKPFYTRFGFGMIMPHGHVDFYFNSGSYQPGCFVPDNLHSVMSLVDLARFPFDYESSRISCSHERSHAYLIEAYNSSRKCVFWGHKVKSSDIFRYISNLFMKGLLSDLDRRWDICDADKCIPFGLYAINSTIRGVVIVNTNYEPPYCLPQPWGYSQ